MTRNNRKAQPQAWSDATIMTCGGTALALAACSITWVAYHVGTLLQTGTLPHAGLFAVARGLADGTLAWPGIYGWLLVALQIIVGTLLAAVGAALHARRGAGGTRIDARSRYLGQGGDIASLGERAVRRAAARPAPGTDAIGLPLGRHIPSGETLYMTWEDTLLTIAGPRTGKTTCLVIPSILAAPGAVLCTSNKSDVIDAVRAPRARSGTVWAFDPQHVSRETQTWWWNPLAYVTDEVSAQRMAGFFAASSVDADARRDAFFDTASENLLGYLLLACSLADQPITKVWFWLTHTVDTEPATILESHGYLEVSESLQAIIDFPDKQKQGVYGSAQNIARVLTSPQVMAWVTPRKDGAPLERFDVPRFVRSSDTLCLMSREGAGTAGAFVLCLTAAVSEAAEDLARRQGGRLRVPLLAVLDEAANICRWRELPDLYSHYGGRGIVMMTFLQSWSQGAAVWGREGMAKLYSAANMSVSSGASRRATCSRP